MHRDRKRVAFGAAIAIGSALVAFGAAIAIGSALVVAVGAHDLYADYWVEKDPLLLTLFENTFPLALTVVLLAVGVAVAVGSDRVGVDALRLARWTLVSALAVSAVGAWAIGFQSLQGTYNPHVIVAYTGVLGGIAGTVIGVYDGKRREKTRALERQREEIARRERVHGAFRDVAYGLVSATTREEIERTACDDLVDRAPFGSAWVGEVRDANDAVTVNGRADETPVDDDGPGVTAAKTAAETGKPVITTAEPGTPDAAAAPVAYEETRYGVLVVRSESGAALTAVERSSLAELGEIIGHAISATKSRQALATDSAVELEFEVSGESCCLAAATEEHDCAIELEGTVSVDGSLRGVYSVRDGDAETILSATTEHDAISDGELLWDAADEGRLELRFDDGAINEIVANHGGVVRETVAADGTTRFRVELPQRIDVRAVVEAVQASFPETDLTARRDVARPVRSSETVRDRLDQALTERQETALKTAFLRGYYDSPRRRTGEEIAASLGVSGPTFHEHLRLGQRKLIDTYLNPEKAER